MKNNYSKLSTILYVEDEEGVRKGYERAIARHAKELYLAENGQQGLELYLQYKPDIVITDIKMPVMNGIEMAKKIKLIDPEQEIIITTAHSETGYFMAAIELQISSYLLKPVDKNLLTKKILNIAKTQQLNNELVEKQALMEEIANLQNNMLVVYDQFDQLIFVNKHLHNFFDVKDIGEFLEKYKSLSANFIQNEDVYFQHNSFHHNSFNHNSFHHEKNINHWTHELLKLDEDKRLVSLNDRSQSIKTFLVNVRSVVSNKHKICSLSEVTRITTKTKEFEIKAYIDELTKIPNRAKFNQAIKIEVDRFQRYQDNLSLVMFDIDHFKVFNDTYGHQQGDDILYELARVVENRVRTTDTFARWGGEEFVILLANTDQDEATNFAQLMRHCIEQYQFKNDLKLTCSFGVATIIKDDTTESLLKRADTALYQAKEGGRNKVIFL